MFVYLGLAKVFLEIKTNEEKVKTNREKIFKIFDKR